MATSRTGTAVWKKLRKQAIRRAKRDGITNCPECGILLDYQISGLRNSAEVDHVIAHSQGGLDRISNTRICCRRCNQSLGAKIPKVKVRRQVVSEVLPTSQEW